MSLWPTLWELQPVAVDVVEVTAFKLFDTVIGHRHGDERVHAVKAALKDKIKTQGQKTGHESCLLKINQLIQTSLKSIDCPSTLR